MKISIPFKRLVPNARPPKKAHEGDTGWDVVAASSHVYMKQTNVEVFHTGLAFAVPKGVDLQVRARSSIYKTGYALPNGIGTIDSGYRGEVLVILYQVKSGTEFTPYQTGQRVAQLVVGNARPDDEVEFVEVEELPPSEDARGNGGFGSTGV